MVELDVELRIRLITLLVFKRPRRKDKQPECARRTQSECEKSIHKER